MDAMEQFELCYPLDKIDEKFIVIPDLLPTEQPTDLSEYFDSRVANTLALQLDFDDFLPTHLIPNLMVKRHTDILKDKNGVQLIWKQGMVIGGSKEQAQITVDEQEKRLYIWVQGTEARDYLVLIRDALKPILAKLKKRPNEYVILPDFARIIPDSSSTLERASYPRFEQAFKTGEEKIASDNAVYYDLKKVAQHFMTPQQQMTVVVKSSDIPASPKKDPLEWWVISLIIALLSASLTGLAFHSLIITAVIFIGMFFLIYALNPRRYLMKAGFFCFGGFKFFTYNTMEL